MRSEIGGKAALAAVLAGGCAGSETSSGEDTLPAVGTTDDGSDPGSTGADDADDGDDGGACVPGMQSPCACPGGGDGVQVCRNDGEGFDACECEAGESDDGTPTDDTTGAPEPCGNGTCDADETCESCEEDCGVCEPCTLAPSCEGAQIPPAIDVHADFLDDPMAYVPPPELAGKLAAAIDDATPAARLIAAALDVAKGDEPELVGTLRSIFAAHPIATDAVRRQLAVAGMPDPAAYRDAHPATLQTIAVPSPVDAILDPVDPVAAPCDDPRVRIRVARLDVHEEDDDFYNDEVYCAITAEAGEAGEIKITPLTPALDEGDSYTYNLDAGLVWGQSDLTAPKGNILLSYNCIESDTDSGYTDLLAAVGDAANAAGAVDVPGVDGWVFPTVGIVADLLGGALALDGDDMLFNSTQVVSEDVLLELVNGAWWSVRRDGTNLNSDWDWELRMEIWGCHDYGTG